MLVNISQPVVKDIMVCLANCMHIMLQHVEEKLQLVLKRGFKKNIST